MAIVIVDDLDGGCVLAGGSWSATSNALFYNGATHYTNTAGWTATYTFSGLTAGTTYVLGTTWGAGQGGAAPNPISWQILDVDNGNAVLSSGTYSQAADMLASLVKVDGSSHSIPMQAIGIASPTGSGTHLAFKVTSPAGQTIADAVFCCLPSDITMWFSVADGNWSTAATWIPQIVPATGNVVTVANNVTVDAATTIGTSPNTGGTPAITYSTLAESKTLTVGTGITLHCNGDIKMQASTNLSFLVLNAGSTLVFKPPSGQQYVIDCNVATASISCNGSVGSRCTVQTDKSLGGLSGLIKTGTGTTHVSQGLRTASYTDFVNWGTSSAWGITTRMETTSGDYSITHCTFTGCNLYFQGGSLDAWDGNFTFTGNIVSSSVGITLVTLSGVQCNFAVAPSSGTRIIDSNSFDLHFYAQGMINTTITNNLFVHGTGFASGSYWVNSSYVHSNVYYFDESEYSGGGLPLWGVVSDSYFYDGSASNPHVVGFTPNANVTAYGVINCIVEGAATTGDGEFISMGSATYPGSSTMKVTGNITVPNSVGISPVSMINNAPTNLKVTVEHNTQLGHGESTALVYWGEATPGIAGCYVSVRSNLIADLVGGTADVYVLSDINPGTITTDVLAVPNGTTTFGATNNGIYQGTSGTITANNVSQPCTGYSAIKISTAGNPGSNGNTQCGLHDVLAGGNPNFVAPTRGLAAWGGTPAGGGVATVAGAVAAIAANPALITQAGTGLMPFVREGYRFTNVAYKGASYAGDTSTTDANGNAWSGATPDIGAMAFGGGSIMAFLDQSHCGGFSDMGI